MKCKKHTNPIDRTYTAKQVIDILEKFASRLGQREGQYLPTIQPCKDYIKEIGLEQ